MKKGKTGYYSRKCRGESYRPPKRTIIILCEDSKHEPSYFKAIRQERHLRTVKIEIISGQHGMEPRTLVRNARELKIEREVDDVWCVFDSDQRDYIVEVITEAKKEGLSVAFSNPCIELWFFLHFKYSSATRTQKEMKKIIETYIKNYNEEMDIYGKLQNYKDAIKRAMKLRKHHCTCGNPDTSNPSTGVDRLVSLLFKLKDQS